MTEASLVLQDPARRAEYVASLRGGQKSGAGNVPGLLDAETTFLKGEVFLKKGDYARAVECFSAATKGNPSEPQYKAYLAWARFEDPRARKETVVLDVQRTIQEVVQQQPRFARGHYWLGQLWKFLNEPGRAEQAFREAVNLDKDFIDAGRELRLLEMRRCKGGHAARSDDKGSGLINLLFKK
jgi:tetratricopeptide (TPR) repeat protein